MGFDASAIEPITYNFNPFLNKQGEMPEPSGTKIKEYREGLVKAFQAAGVESVDDLKKLTVEDMGELVQKSTDVEDAYIDATAILTAPGLTAEEIRALPYRPRQAFVGFISGVFANPEA